MGDVDQEHRRAKPGYVWWCSACGKYSAEDSHGTIGKHWRGWDVSCAMHAIQVPGPYVEEPEA